MNRYKDTLTGSIEEMLIMRPEPNNRAIGLHPSEIVSDTWCQRASFYRLSGTDPEPTPPTSLAQEVVFGVGNSAHKKWQEWAWRLGVLRGLWKCISCGLRWEDVSPHACPRCDVGTDMITYLEVPLDKPDYLIVGHADGWIVPGVIDESLIEIKTIGPGTIRWDAAALIGKYTYKHTDENGKSREYVDWYALWNGIKRPFPVHIRQGMLYLFCKGMEQIRFIYEPKMLMARPKEFVIKFDQSIIQDILDGCLNVKSALETNQVPKRPFWAEKKHKVCSECPFRSVCYDNRRNKRNIPQED
jgi:hypothetical protein